MKLVLFLICCLACATAWADPFTIVNAGFETPVLAPHTFVYSPSGYAGQGWSFNGSSGSGITSAGSGFGNPLGPDGSEQAAFIQQFGYIDQTLTGGDAGGTYDISLYVIQRACCSDESQTLSVYFNGVELTFGGSTTIDPTSTTQWTLYTSDPFVAAASSGVLQISGNDPHDDDSTVFVDDVSSQELSAIPEPCTLLLVGSGLMGVIRRARYTRARTMRSSGTKSVG